MTGLDFNQVNIEKTEHLPLEILGYDWRGGEVLQGDRGYLIDGDIVLEQDLKNYIESKYGKAGYL